MRILLTPDAPDWAIANICRDIMMNSKRFQFTMIPVHPRGVGESIHELIKAYEEGIDVWHAHYWNSAIQLLNLMPQFKDIPKVLTHHNHYSLLEKQIKFPEHSIPTNDWKDFNIVTEPTNWGCERLATIHPNVKRVTYGIDLDRFSYLDEYPPKEPAVGYIGRVVPWKHLGDVTETAKKLGYNVIGAGFVDKPDYWETVEKSNLKFLGGNGRSGMTPANIKDDLYSQMSVFVMYSTDEKESGTLPLLEAMARGVPVLTTWQGIARDIIKDGENGIVFTPENFEEKLKMLMEDEPLRQKLRKQAWETIKTMSAEKMAREFEKVYYKALYGDMPLVSVIVTTYNRPDALLDTILSIDKQSYPAKEIIVADDGSTDENVKIVIEKARKMLKTPIVHVYNDNKSGYDLGKIRNMALLEAMGKIVMIFQDRFTLDEGMLEKIVAYSHPKQWGYGSKRVKGKINEKDSFLEGFSWCHKSDLANLGGFNERINLYGGQSQELRLRSSRQGMVANYFPDVIATEIVSTRNSSERRKSIWKAKMLIDKWWDYLK